jgi:hypothetical protein
MLSALLVEKKEFLVEKISTGLNPMEEEMCLVDSGTTNTILRETKYFQTLTKSQGNVLTIAGCDATIVGSGCATITLPMGTQIQLRMHYCMPIQLVP